MITWLQKLMEEADQIVLDGQPGPEVEPEEGDTVIGELPDNLKKLSILLTKTLADLANECGVMHREAAAMAGRVLGSRLGGDDTAGPTAEEKARFDEHNAKHRHVDMVRSLFWHSLRLEVPGARDADVVGLCKGWKVTTSKSKRRLGIELVSAGLAGIPSDLAEALGI